MAPEIRPSSDAIPFGVVIKPRGIQGVVVVKVFNRDTERLGPGLPLWVQREGAPMGAGPEGPRTLYHVLSGSRIGGSDQHLVRFEEVADRGAAEDLRRARLFLPRDAVEAPEADTFYYEDVAGHEDVAGREDAVGYAVVTASGATLGHVHHVFSAASDVLVVRSDSEEWMIPVVSDVVRSIDHGRRVFVVELPEGLDPMPLKGKA